MITFARFHLTVLMILLSIKQIATLINKIMNKTTSSKKYSTQRKIPKYIRFVGNMQQNVDDLIGGIQCKCSCKNQFRQILLIYADKIQKLRAQRQAYKQKYYEDVQILKNELSTLEQAFYSLQQYQKTDQFDKFTEKLQTYEHFGSKMSKMTLRELTNDQNRGSNTERGSLSINLFSTKEHKDEKEEFYENLQSIIKKYNIGLEELQNLVKEYVNEFQNEFDSEEQKKLYRLGKKLEKQIWMKKVKKDIELIISAREQLGEQNEAMKMKNIK